jgi:hypothetical protein
MKKYSFLRIFIITVVIISSVTIQSCKKGKDDPLISFRSRDGRLCRAWNLTNITGYSANNTITFDGSNVIDNNDTLYVSANFTITFVKDATFNFVETKTIYVYNNGQLAPTVTDNSYWAWLNSEKTKEFLQLPESVNPFGLIPASALSGVFYVDCLKASKLILVCNNNSGIADTKLTFTFTAQ